ARLDSDRTHLRRIFATIVAAEGHADRFLAGVVAQQHDQAQLAHRARSAVHSCKTRSRTSLQTRSRTSAKIDPGIARARSRFHTGETGIGETAARHPGPYRPRIPSTLYQGTVAATAALGYLAHRRRSSAGCP